MQGDVPCAVSFVEGEVSRLLTGHVGVWELAMTGGLWRVTGQQLEKAAGAEGTRHVTGDVAHNDEPRALVELLRCYG